MDKNIIIRSAVCLWISGFFAGIAFYSFCLGLIPGALQFMFASHFGG